MKRLHPSIKALLSEIETFCGLRGLSPTTFGKLALNDGHFLHDVKKRGRNPSAFTVDRIREFLNEGGKA